MPVLSVLRTLFYPFSFTQFSGWHLHHPYRYHADCKTLVAFVYDPERHIEEPRSLENDLSKMIDGMPVKVIIAQG